MALDPNVSVPDCVTVIAAPVLPVVVVTALLIAKLVPVKLMPETPVVVRAPLNVVVPLPVPCAIAAALMVKVLRGVLPPTALEREIVPVPAVKVRFWAPLIALERVMFPGPVPPVLRVVAPANVIAPARDRGLCTVRVDPFKETEPPPLWVKLPFARIEAPCVKVPVLAMAMGPVPEVIKLPFWVMAAPVNEMPLLPEAVRVPEMRVVPVLPL